VSYGYRVSEVPLPKIEPVKDCKITDWETPPRTRPVVAASLGPIFKGASMPHPDPSDRDTLKAGVLKRFCMEPPKPCPKLLEELSTFVNQWLKENLTPLSADSDTSVETWLTKTTYPAWRKEQLIRKNHNITDPFDPKLFDVKSFMKDEVYPEYKHARAINSRTDEFKTLVGPIFKLIEKELFAKEWFIKKIPVKDRPAYIEARLGHGSQFFASDYTAYESHFTRIIMEAIEFQLYDYMTQYLPDKEAFDYYLREVIGGTNKCIFKFFSVEVEATRMSGEMNTSLGNGFSNLMVMLFLCSKKGMKNVVGVVEGDDGLFTGEGEMPTTADFRELGFTIKCEIFERLSDASFCGMVYDPTDKVIVTNPLEELVTFGWTTGQYAGASHRRKMELLRCKAISMAYQYGGCPILTSLARYGLRITQKYNARLGSNTNEYEREQFLEAKLHTKGIIRDVPRNTRLLVERLYGITVEDQIKMENYLDSLTTVQPLEAVFLEKYIPKPWVHYWNHFVVDKTQEFPMTSITTAPCV
jgi:hypothetical protein